MNVVESGEVTPTVRKWKPYPAYKESGIQWLGKIPEHWKEKRLKFAAVVNMGQSPNSEEYNIAGDGLPFLQGNAEFGVDHPEPKLYCPTARKRALPGDILLSVRAPVGALNVADQEYGIGRGLCTISPNDDGLGNKFARYLLEVVRLELNIVATGSTYEAVSVDEVASLRCVLPPLREQRTIVDFLNHETAKIDALVKKKERLIELLQEKRTAIITQAVTKGLNPNVPMKDSGVEWLGKIPAHWEVKKTKFTVSFYGGGTPSKENADYWRGDIPWVSPKDMRSEIVTDSEDHVTQEAVTDSATRLIEPGAVLIVVRSGILKHSIPVAINASTVTLNQDMKALVPKAQMKPSYLKYLIVGHQDALLVEWRKAGATVESIEHELLANSYLPIPPVPEQAAISSFLEQETIKIDSFTAKVREGIEKLKEYRTALISAAVTGKIDVREGASAAS